MPLTRARTAADWRERLDRFGARAMTTVGDWIAPGSRAAASEPRISALVALVAVVGGVLPILIMAVTWASKPDPVAQETSCARSGYVLAGEPDKDRYRPENQCNAAGGENVVERTGTGRYLVTFAGLGEEGGVAEVTPVTGDDRICTLPDWHPDGDDELVRVDCFDRFGQAADSGFAARFWHPRGGDGTAAYLRLGDPGRTSQTIDDAYSYNSAGGTNSADREDVGSYVVYFGQQTSGGGTVKVTAAGDAATVCGVERWSADEAGRQLVVRVRCRDAAGQAVDSRFAVTFAVRAGAAAYLLAEHPAEPEYTPAGGSQFNGAGRANSVTRSGPGEYRVAFPGLPAGRGVVQVTSYATAATCVISAEDHERVVCRDPSGAPADAQFAAILWQ
ncbi:hypothetical protein GCM10010168_72850 [Actinoplanes ianthinogenes]|uniref:Uncharacterized protein n=1 Tax=Actinoplanes ianthinogenes TaxID=122358 RepID=A0ABM7LN82_9ACTN|nr:hypothetical protein [Actinoplanes ianthinogenes]BCJ40727.1 hypothetical protein Aiant_13840 [Actinoplanes ianthinogenes]GGR43323.1 hypothetical protein GCM10010168_72850 [Actinoplanes ianthinogenes]